MNIIKLNAIGSTNEYLKNLSKETNLADGTVVMAKDQTKGRGQMGTSWWSESGKSLAFSVFKSFEGIALDQQFTITIQVSLSLIKCLQQFGIPNLSVKWPNDIMSDGKKLCGILIENQVQGNRVTATVVGIGLNVNNNAFPKLPKATSMLLSSGHTFPVEGVFQTIIQEIIGGLTHFYADHHHLFGMYEESLFRKDQVSVFSANEKQFNGIIRGISPMGELKVELEDEAVQTYRLKEIQLLN
ncbi:biotin--[acetyl-CoA-carboxylase] ligase [Aureisphaera galaxeae]|uniref:biotin--[acetyl-CoA-carboxylase] ligase n=1 Tax=Aureisphaera galaxeae TaxID=1538023 RepID=UPI0023506E66|nr:biotin--[acetyl-CoA-carboxylase] ligase [Aureisphaera galaxeae]MDC8006130.1 biotin--[acetyl-CoA-carboxylase] ligase [Aureisphaera galaxeae]